MELMSDEELMKQFCGGNTDAFQVLFDKYKNRIFSFIYAMYEHNISKAEDCLQETFIRAIKHRDSFNPTMRFSTWLFAIAKNYCLNELRNNKRNLYQLDHNIADKENSDFSSAEQILGQKELETLILQALSELPDTLRSVFIMREINQLPYAEIAEISNLKESNIRIQLFRAKQKLQKIITPYLENKNEY